MWIRLRRFIGKVKRELGEEIGSYALEKAGTADDEAAIYETLKKEDEAEQRKKRKEDS